MTTTDSIIEEQLQDDVAEKVLLLEEAKVRLEVIQERRLNRPFIIMEEANPVRRILASWFTRLAYKLHPYHFDDEED